MQLRSDLDAAMVIVEHDVPLLVSIVDRLQCLVAGRTIADGRPTDVISDVAVVDAYLGRDDRAIKRSGAKATTAGPLH